MSWRFFLPLPLAALLLGQPVAAPHLSDPLPVFELAGCDYAQARRFYLLGYAYSRELPAVAGKFLSAAEAERARCVGNAAALAARIGRLRASLP